MKTLFWRHGSQKKLSSTIPKTELPIYLSVMTDQLTHTKEVVHMDLLKESIWESHTGIPQKEESLFFSQEEENWSICSIIEENTNKWKSNLSKRQLSVLTSPQNTEELLRNRQSIQTVQKQFCHTSISTEKSRDMRDILKKA